jgi:uncharacterized protein (DUF2252 family)
MAIRKMRFPETGPLARDPSRARNEAMSASPRTSRASSGYPSRDSRYEAGKALRRRVTRSSHAVWSPPRNRPDIIDLLEASDPSREPQLLPIRYGRMSISPFAYLRGSADVMARDLAATPVTGLRAQLCGDAHLSNFGFFATPERAQVFDVNDFDETLPGPWEWDVKRLATSLVVAGRRNGNGRSVNRKAARTAVRAYRESMTEFGKMRYLDIWYAHLDVERPSLPVGPSSRKLIGRAASRARRKTSLSAFPKMAEVVNGRYRIRNDPPLIVHYKDATAVEESRSFYDRYLASLPDERRMLLDRYHIADVAQKVVGVGSVGMRCAVLLLVADPDVEDPLFLQLKQAKASALEPFLGISPYPNHAERVVVGQHMVQEASDIFLGWSELRDRDFYVRQLRDMTFSYDISTLGPREFIDQAKLCGTALARGHARTGDPAAISGYLGNRDVFDRAVTTFAEAYADQTQRDYHTLLKAIKKGRLPSRVDV